ncbi:MAG: flagellar hook-length control protein FliK [Pseudomonadota bacterium]
MRVVDRILLSSGRVELQPLGKPLKSDLFRKNEIIEGRVLKVFSASSALISIKGEEVMARTLIPLHAGDRSQFQVEQVYPQTVLRMIEIVRHDTAKPSPVFLNRNSESIPTSLPRGIFKLHNDVSLFKSITEWVSRSSHKIREGDESYVRDLAALIKRLAFQARPGETDGRFLEKFIDGSGLAWEHKLKTLCLNNALQNKAEAIALLKEDTKGLAMQIVKEQAQAQPEGELAAFTDLLEQLQLVNYHALEDKGKGKLFLPFPLFSQEGFTFGQLLIDLSSGSDSESETEGDASKRIVKISFLLQPKGIGQMRADMSVYLRHIQGSFLVGDESVKRFIEQYLPELRGRFEKVGFFVDNFTCRVDEAKALEETSLVSEFMGPVDYAVHLVV